MICVCIGRALARLFCAGSGTYSFELLPRVAKKFRDGSCGRNRAVRVVVGEIWCLLIRLRTQIIAVCKAVVLAGRIPVLLEQAGQFEIPPYGGEALEPFHTECTDAFGVKIEIWDIRQMRHNSKQPFDGQRDDGAAQHCVWNTSKVTGSIAGSYNAAIPIRPV